MREKFLLVGVWAWASGCLAQTCQPYWRSAGPTPAPVPSYNRVVEFDDGSGKTAFLSTSFGPAAVWKWSGASWTPITVAGIPATNEGVALLVLDDGAGPGLFAYGRFGTPFEYRAFRFGSQGWAYVPGLLTDIYRPMASARVGAETRIYGLGNQNSAQNNFIARWDGGVWENIGSSSGGLPSIFDFDDGGGSCMYIIGIDTIAGVSCNGFARWDGQSWSAPTPWVLGEHMDSFSWATFDDGRGPAVYTAHLRLDPGALNYRAGVFRFDGHDWSLVGYTEEPVGTLTSVTTLRVFDDGRGPALYIAGGFNGFGGIAARGIVRWDGRGFEPLGQGSGTPDRLIRVDNSYGHALMAAGVMTAGGGQAHRAALWVACPNCYANCDLSGAGPRLNVLDFNCFLNKFAAQDPYANCNVDAAIDVMDFACFLGKFGAGCP